MSSQLSLLLSMIYEQLSTPQNGMSSGQNNLLSPNCTKLPTKTIMMSSGSKEERSSGGKLQRGKWENRRSNFFSLSSFFPFW